MKKLLALLAFLALSAPAYAADNYVVTDAGGNFKVLSCTDVANVCTYNFNGTIGSITPGTGAANLGKAEDAPHVTGDTGIQILGVRKDTAAAFGADGDYTPIRTDQFGDVAVFQTSSYPFGAIPETATSGIVANASAVATLATAAGKTTYISGFSASPGMATGSALVKVVVSGLITGSMTFYVAATNATTFVPAPNALIVPINPPIPASAANTTIVVTMDAVGAGGATAAVNAWGFQL